MSDKEINLYLNEIMHTMDCEGLTLSEQNTNDIISILQGKRTCKKVKESILMRYGLLP